MEVLGEELNGLGLTLRQIIEDNMQIPEVKKKVRSLRGTLVVREKQSRISVTIFFNKGNLMIQNDALDKMTAFIEAGFLELADISSGRLGPIKALLSGKIKARGNLIKLLEMSHVLISR
jgi:putative sterol carrier protein